MNKLYAIFDMDGTILDSMPFWEKMNREYLIGKGLNPVPAEFAEKVKTMSLVDSSTYFVKELGIPGTIDEVCAERRAWMEGHYRTDIPLKPGVRSYLNALRRRGVRMCIASATPTPLVEVCLRRLKVLDHFEFLISCEEVGKSKQFPDVFLEAVRRLGAGPEDVAVYEDALTSIRTAKSCGCYTVGAWDNAGRGTWGEIEALADEVILSWSAAAAELEAEDTSFEV